MDSHSLIRFLDKFVYRNAKATDSARGVSIMQPLRATKDAGDIYLGSKGKGAGAASVNTSAFWNKKAADVAAEDIFFHEYFQNMSRQPKQSANKVDPEDEDAQEDEIWKALVSAQPDIEEDGSELGFDDLDELDMASLDGSSPALSLGSDIDDLDDDDEMGETSDIDEDGEDELVQLGEDSDEEEDEEEEDGKDDKKTHGRTKQRERKKALKALPMFASVDDYAELLQQEEEGM